MPMNVDEDDAARRWWIVALLGLLLATSLIDRQILALLVDPIASAMQVSDTEIGLLLGAGFGVLYSLAGLPLAHWLDRGHRIRIVVIGVVVWSGATIGAAFTHDYWSLMACRAAVAIGEAVLSPAAVSLIADMFAPNRRTLPISLYTAVGGLMAAGAFAVGGVAIDIAVYLAPTFELDVWRLTLILVGSPGIVLAVVLALSAPEPSRRQEASDAQSYASPLDAWRYLVRERRLLVPLFGAIALLAIEVYALLGWAVTLMIRGYTYAPAEAGYLFGIIGVSCGVAGTALWPWLSHRLQARGRCDALVWVFIAASAIGTVGIAMIAVVATRPMLLMALSLAVFGLSAASVLPPLAIQMIAPARMRARMMAINLLSISLVGVVLGPLLVAVVAEHFFDGPRALGQAMALVALVLGPLALAGFAIALRPFARHAGVVAAEGASKMAAAAT